MYSVRSLRKLIVFKKLHTIHYKSMLFTMAAALNTMAAALNTMAAALNTMATSIVTDRS